MLGDKYAQKRRFDCYFLIVPLPFFYVNLRCVLTSNCFKTQKIILLLFLLSRRSQFFIYGVANTQRTIKNKAGLFAMRRSIPFSEIIVANPFYTHFL